VPEAYSYTLCKETFILPILKGVRVKAGIFIEAFKFEAIVRLTPLSRVSFSEKYSVQSTSNYNHGSSDMAMKPNDETWIT